MKAPNSKALKKFHFMVAATIVFVIKGDESRTTQMVPINGMVLHDKDQFATEQLAQAQKVVQMQLFKKLGEEAVNIEVLDVVITNVMNLGFMTDEEFQFRPEVKKPELSVVSQAVAAAGMVQ